MDKIYGKIRAAIDKYDMIPENAKVAVGVSGGKDSLVLMYCLAKISQYHPKNFTVTAITADPAMNGEETDYSAVQRLCDELNVEYIIRRTSLGKIIFEDRKEKNPCSMCARMRRGILHSMALEAGCNILALGHHGDDAVQTFMMNLLDGGSISCFSPKSYLSRRDLWMIRPMIFCSEASVSSFARLHDLPVVKSTCPVDGHTERKNVADIILHLEKDYPDLKAKIIGAMERAQINGWK